MYRPIYSGFTVLELSKFVMYETYYDKLQPHFGEKGIQFFYMDTDSSVFKVDTKVIIRVHIKS